MTDALERLIKAVAAGRWDGSWRAVLDADKMMPPQAFSDAYHGDMSAAIAVQKALLPDHDWGRAPGGQMWVHRPTAAPVWSGDGYPPARGLLLAMLRAYAGERVSETADR